VDLALATPDLSTLVAALEAAELVAALQEPGPFTVVAPINDAFAALGPELDRLLLPENQQELADILLYHVVPAEVFAGDLSDGLVVETLLGATWTVRAHAPSPTGFAIDTDGDGAVDSNIIAADFDASNGVVHLLDAVLLPPAGEAGLIAEAGFLTLEQPDERFRSEIRFSVDLDDTPVVVLPTLSTNSRLPAFARVEKLNADGFDFWVDEWDYQNGAHPEEAIPYLITLDGTYLLEDGRQLEGGFKAGVGERYVTIEFDVPFSAPPVVFAQAATRDRATRVSRAIITRVRNVTATSFEVKIQDQRSNRDAFGKEDISWVAIEEGVSTGFEVPAVGRTLPEIVDAWRYFAFGTDNPTPGEVPVVLVQTQTENEGDPVMVRYRNLDANGIEIRLYEDNSDGRGTAHAPEVVGYAVLPAKQFLGTPIGDSSAQALSEAGLGTEQVFPVRLLGNYPNPAVNQTRIGFALDAPQAVRVEVFDLTGRRIATLVDGTLDAGVQEAVFDTSGLASGIYLYRLTSGGFTTTQRMTVVR
ncbi:MAG: fasciclin domain-containing protein, partial [Bacteroidota bacterium]